MLTIGCCAAGLCARSALSQHRAPQQATAGGERPVTADVAPTESGHAVRNTDVSRTGVNAEVNAKVVAHCNAFAPVLRRFCESLKGTGEQVEILFVSGDRSEQEILDDLRNEHGEWFVVDCKAEDPTLIVNGTAENVVPEAHKEPAGTQSAAAVQAASAEWKKVAGDWRESAGTALGGGIAGLPKDPAALRAARLAALEGRLGGGTPAAPAAPDTYVSNAAKEQVSHDAQEDAAEEDASSTCDTCFSNAAKDQVGQDAEEDAAEEDASSTCDTCFSNAANQQVGQDAEEDDAEEDASSTCDTCITNAAKEQVGQEVEEDAAEEDASSTCDTCFSNAAKEQVGQDAEEGAAEEDSSSTCDTCFSNTATEQVGQDAEEDVAEEDASSTCDTCITKAAKEQVGQDVEEDAAEEDASSTFVGSLDEGHLGDTDSADSVGSWTGANAATGHQSMEAEELSKPRAKRVTFKLEPDEWCSAYGLPAVCSSFKPWSDEKPPCQRQPVVCGSFKLGSDSTSPGALAAGETATAAAAATEPQDAAGRQAAITQATLDETAERTAVDLAAAEAAAEEVVTEVAAAEQVVTKMSIAEAAAVEAAAELAAELAADLAAAQTPPAQSQQISVRIVGRSEKFYTIVAMAAANQQAVDSGPSQFLTRRFQEFVALDKMVRPRHRALPELPQKSVFFRKNFKRGFMDDREQQLGAYLSALVADSAAVAEPSVQRFLGFAC